MASRTPTRKTGTCTVQVVSAIVQGDQVMLNVNVQSPKQGTLQVHADKAAVEAAGIQTGSRVEITGTWRKAKKGQPAYPLEAKQLTVLASQRSTWRPPHRPQVGFQP